MGFFFEGPAMAKTKGILNSCWLLCKIHRDSQIPYLHTHIMAFPQIKKENTIYQDPRYIWRWPEAKLTSWRKNEILLLCLLFSVFWEQIGVWKMKEQQQQQLSSQELERKTLILYKAEDERPLLLTKYVCHYTTSNSFHNAFSKGYLAQG